MLDLFLQFCKYALSSTGPHLPPCSSMLDCSGLSPSLSTRPLWSLSSGMQFDKLLNTQSKVLWTSVLPLTSNIFTGTLGPPCSFSVYEFISIRTQLGLYNILVSSTIKCLGHSPTNSKMISSKYSSYMYTLPSTQIPPSIHSFTNYLFSSSMH